MKYLVLFGLLSFSLWAKDTSGDMERPHVVSLFQPTAAGFSIPNTHEVDWDEHGDPAILRSNMPWKGEHFQEIKDQGVKRVIILKTYEPKSVDKGRKNDIEQEIEILEKMGYKDIATQDGDLFYKHIPFRWKNFKDFETPCLQTVQALRLLKNSIETGEKILFHCTVGEDRTGYLAGLYHLLSNPERDVKEVFHTEMCAHGYEGGSTRKPFDIVVKPIREDLTPQFLKMVYRLQSNGKHRLTWDHLTFAACDYDPVEDKAFTLDSRYDPEQYKCNHSKMPLRPTEREANAP